MAYSPEESDRGTDRVPTISDQLLLAQKDIIGLQQRCGRLDHAVRFLVDFIGANVVGHPSLDKVFLILNGDDELKAPSDFIE